MNKAFSTVEGTTDCRLCMASIAGVYSPLILILTAALVVI
jgi:hypothetical protein